MDTSQRSHDDPKNQMSISYDESYFAQLFKIERRHFWFRARSEVIMALTKQLVEPFPAGYKVLEIGCGTGNVLNALKKTCQNGCVFGLDLFWRGLFFTRQRTPAALIQANVDSMPFPQGQFHLVGMFDVLEHLTDDQAVLQKINHTLAVGGKLIISVPAHRDLWSYFDIISHHQRRYELTELADKLKSARFEVEYASQYMSMLYHLVKRRKKLPDDSRVVNGRTSGDLRRKTSRELTVIPLINEIVYQILRLELNRIRERRIIPRGTSILAIARKR